MTDKKSPEVDAKSQSLEPFRRDLNQGVLTTDQGVRVESTDDSLKVGPRGPTLLEDFHAREKLMRFDHERIPERVVHARGSGAHGYFQVYKSLSHLTRAAFLQDPSVKTPVFVRFSTVAGSKGSLDTARDVRGFATKFYTSEGNFDLVGNNIPVFFIQDGIKFPDIIHAVKPEPDREIPQAASAHDTFWDFASLVPETTHMLLWILSDRAIPRSFRMMQGFGVHTFRLVDEKGTSRFVKFHWRPLLGVASLVWDEAQKLGGKDGDFHRRDLWDAIASGAYPEYELALQIIEEKDEHAFDFDLLDATKLVPEELVPVIPVGKMTLDRNPDNFFAETEQVAFCTANVVPGIDFTDDPLLQMRNFSYLDTQLLRLGGPNFVEIPINRPIADVRNFQKDGHMQVKIPKGRAHYTPNSLGGGCPVLASAAQGAFVHYPEELKGRPVRERSPSFADHYSQATLFWNSMSDPEKDHIVAAARFELGNVESEAVRRRMIEGFARVDLDLARRVAEAIGVPAPKSSAPQHRPAAGKKSVDRSPALSMANLITGSIKTRRIAVLATHGVKGADIAAARKALTAEGAEIFIVAEALGPVKTAEGKTETADKTLLTTASVWFDAVLVPGGQASVDALKKLADARQFVNEAFRHYKPIGGIGEGVDLLAASDLKGITLAGAQSSAQAGGQVTESEGVVTTRGGSLDPFFERYIAAVGQHRHWGRKDAQS